MEASREAVQAYIADFRDALSEINSVDELEYYARDLKRLMREYGVQNTMVDYRIDTRREEILDDESNQSGDFEALNKPKVSDEISDDEVRSMFSGLRPKPD